MFPVPLELRPDAPEGGLSASANGLGHSQKVEEYLVRVAADEGLPMMLPDLVPNTHRAIVLSEVARDAGPAVHRAAHAAVFLAHYGEGLDIGAKDVLLRVAESVDGLDPAAVGRAWENGAMEGRIHEFRHMAAHLGIDTTPAALICNELLVGSRPYAVLAQAVSRCLLTAADAEVAGPGTDASPAAKR